MRVAMQQTWYFGGAPEYRAGREYDVDDALGARFVRRGVAVSVTVAPAAPPAPEPAPVVDDAAPPVRQKATRKKRSTSK